MSIEQLDLISKLDRKDQDMKKEIEMMKELVTQDTNKQYLGAIKHYKDENSMLKIEVGMLKVEISYLKWFTKSKKRQLIRNKQRH